MILGVANTWEERKGLKDFIELSKRIGRNDFIVLVGLSQTQMKKLPNHDYWDHADRKHRKNGETFIQLLMCILIFQLKKHLALRQLRLCHVVLRL